MSRLISIIIIIIILNTITISISPSYAQGLELKYNVEKVVKCGFIFEFLPDGNIICATRIGEIRLLNINDNRLTTLTKIDDVYMGEQGEPAHERGLVGLTLDPLFKENHYVYLQWTYKDPVDQKQYKKVARFVYDDEEKRLTDMKILLDRIPANQVHNGGPMEFGPDGLLYITNGDADNSPQSRKRILDNPSKRSLSTLDGKILRIDRDGRIPSDNPFPNSPIYTTGHRNVFGIAFHPITGLPYITENGPDTDDEINILYKGQDYGWPITLGYDKPIAKEEEFDRYNFTVTDHVKPIWSSGNITTAPTQIAFYTGSKYPEFANDLLFLTLNDSSLNRVKLAPPDYTRISNFTVYELNIGIPTDIEVDSNGEIYVANISAEIWRIRFYYIDMPSKREPVSLHLEQDKSFFNVGDVVSFKAVLLDSDGNPLFYKPINFILNDQVIGTVRTKDDGSASIKYELTSTDKYVIRAEFLGDDGYMQSSDSYAFVSIAKDMVARVSTYETLLFNDSRPDPNTIVRLSVFPVEDGNKLSNVNPTIFTIELIDKETLSTIDGVRYNLTIVKDDGTILLSEEGQTGSSNIHLYTFDSEDGSKITLKVRYNDKDAVLTFTVVPEFLNNHILLISLLSMLILIPMFGNRLIRHNL